MPNGDPGGGGVPVFDILEGPDVPGTPIPTGPVGGLIEATVGFFSGLFGGGKSAKEQFAQAQWARDITAGNLAIRERVRGGGLPPTAEEWTQLQLEMSPQDAQAWITAATPSPITGRLPIPTPELGGPPLVTERLINMPMVVDAPLLQGSFLPALRQATTPAVTGFIGGLAQDLVSGLFARPLGELGLGQIPMAQPTAVARVGGCPPEKPSTRILRFIKQNTGVSINLSRAKSLIRELGLENAARCLGITAQEVCQLLIVASPRRRRGISASDIRIVKRTARRFEALKHSLGHLGGRPTHHRRGHRHGHAHK